MRRLVSKATARSTDKLHRSESQSELDETAPLPVLPDGTVVSTEAANDTAFSLSDKVTDEDLERLIKLTESMDRCFERITEALATTQSLLPQGKKKKSRSKK